MPMPSVSIVNFGQVNAGELHLFMWFPGKAL